MSTRVRVSTVCQHDGFQKTIDANRDYVMGLLDQAMAGRPDVVCLPESFTLAGVGDADIEARTESIDGPTVEAAAKRARENRCYVLCPVKTKRDGLYWNSTVIIDRSGQVAGIYDKLFPVTSSNDYTAFEYGITPGREVPVFDLDFGRIGLQICFDMGFKETWAALSEKGARAVFWASAYDGGFPLRAFAYIHRYWLISSVRRGQSRIVDPCGEILLETTPEMPIVTRDINMDFAVVHEDFNHDVGYRIHEKYGNRVNIRRSPGAGHFLVEPTESALTCEALQQEFGFETTEQYHERHRVAARRIHAGEELEPQKALHGDRVQYEPWRGP